VWALVCGGASGERGCARSRGRCGRAARWRAAASMRRPSAAAGSVRPRAAWGSQDGSARPRGRGAAVAQWLGERGGDARWWLGARARIRGVGLTAARWWATGACGVGCRSWAEMHGGWAAGLARLRALGRLRGSGPRAG
jgi:hypothetical protein